MIVSVGYQSISRSNILNDFSTRTIPHFEDLYKYPVSTGLVEYSFLTVTEFFFDIFGGTEGLVSTPPIENG